ncbi:MAG: pentapeptide repeat-containing protein [Bacteroidales bacterium]|jgi:uncharacterized protein YjbI with pentapeptide repeats|nr:pentapeptide repeat-containing protein [Bacteroidales bacterium]
MPQNNYIEDKTFDKIDFTIEGFPKGEYEYCIFKNCNFSNSDLSRVNFLECEFINCDLSLVKTNDTAFRIVKFKSSKILGVHFENCNKLGFSLSFDDCILNHSSFYQLKMKKTIFTNSKLEDVDFAETDLNGVCFLKCDMKGASFNFTNLENADLRTSYNYSIDPETNKLKKAKFSFPEVTGLLDKYDIIIN